MNQVIGVRPPVWFRALAVLALLWNLLGTYQYLLKVGMFGDPLAGLTEGQRMLAESVPGWVTGVFAIAVFSGLLGSVGLVLSKRWAKPLLILSLLALVIQCAWILFMSDAQAVEGALAIAMPLVLIGLGVLWVGIAEMGIKRAWLT